MVISVLAMVVTLPSLVQAAAPDEEFLIRKGYSPEVAEMVGNVRSRVEWSGMAPPKRSPFKQFLYNVIHNDPMGNIDESGYNTIRRI
jgi:hypothetical protein